MKEPTVFWKYDSEKTVNYPERKFDLDIKTSSLEKLANKEARSRISRVETF